MPLPFPGRIAELLRRSTIQIRTGSAQRQGHGSGVLLDGGRIITNAHVVGTSLLVTVESWEGRTLEGRVLRVDGRRDLALVSAPDLAGSPPLALGDSDLLRPGTPVIAIGHPLGFVGAASSGVVHRIGRAPDHWIMADLHLAPGNSGGPLANFRGEVVGINTMVLAGAPSRLALAIPSRLVQRFLSIGERGRVLGVSVRPVRLRGSAAANPRVGLMLMEVVAGSSADGASLLVGDILLEANGRTLSAPEHLEDLLAHATDDILHLRFTRGDPNRLREVAVALTSRPIPHAA